MLAMDLLDRLRTRISSLPAVRLVALFGSTARGEARPRSDIDLGVLLDPDTPALRREVEAELGGAAEREIDLIFLAEAPPLLRFEISSDGVLLFEKEDGLWTEFKVRAMVDWWDWAPYSRMFTAAAVRRLRERVKHGQT
jgi:predicted nucleotidyltransferase